MANKQKTLLVDTSVAVALLVADHDHHDRVFEALEGRTLGLSGHAAFETHSVLTRLPPPARRTPAVVQRLLEANFVDNRFLTKKGAAATGALLAGYNLAGGSVYDALTAAAAAEHGLRLASRDRRAEATYDQFEVDLLWVD